MSMGCDHDAPSGFGPDDFEAVDADADDAAAPEADPLPGSPLERAAQVGPHPSSGWLDFDDAVVTPWCGATLVAPDVAVTATHCVQGVHPDRMHVGFGSDVADGYAVGRLETLQAAPELTAVVLTESVIDVEPATLGGVLADGTPIESISYLHVPRGEATDRWRWRGRAADGMVQVLEGEPNCHSDPGAGAYDDRGALVGIVIGGSVEEGLCVDSVRLAHPEPDADADDAFDEALALGD